MNQLILGDNLEIMRKMDSESIDLIYIKSTYLLVLQRKNFKDSFILIEKKFTDRFDLK
jgi:DNA modification methylase